MQLQIAVAVVCFLEQNIGADPGLLEHPVFLHRGRGDVHIHAADRAVFVLDGIDCLDGFQNIFDGIVHGVLARFNRETLVAHIL